MLLIYFFIRNYKIARIIDALQHRCAVHILVSRAPAAVKYRIGYVRIV